jgi:hypothetical protein
MKWKPSVIFMGIVTMVALAVILFQSFILRSNNLNNSQASNSLILKQTIIDSSPPSGNKCCLDVLAIADIDGDERADVMVGSQNSVGAVWYHYPDWTRYQISEGEFTTDGEIADLDRDGDGDVILSDYKNNAIAWWENTGDPFKSSGWIRHQIGDRFAHDLAVGDINGDGNLDVAIFAKNKSRQLTWFAAPADPSEPWSLHEIDTPPGEGLDLGDIDGDGDTDIAASRNWYENQDGKGLSWTKHQITANWGEETRTIIADMNNDGKQDLVLSHSEGKGRLSWFANPNWQEHPIESEKLNGCHSLEVGDLDNDGDRDVFAGEMNTGGSKVIVYENLGSDRWNRIILSRKGTHNARLGDIAGDGNLDIVGKNYTGDKVIELWQNLTSKPKLTLNDWTYIQVDDARESFNKKIRFFGLAMGDVTGDGYQDIISGRYFYRNPGGDMTGKWSRVTFPLNLDAMLIVDVDGDEMADAIAEALPNVYWLEAKDSQGNSWSVTKIGTMPKTSHINGQGYQLAQIVPGGKPEILLAGGKGDREIYYFTIPDNPSEGNWQRTLITNEATDEGIGVGDIDRDGDIDIAAGDMHTGGKKVSWWENPGNGKGNWTKHKIGNISQWPDRFALADINGDNKLDAIVTEENQGKKPDAHVYWFEQPENLQNSVWTRHLLTTQYTTNSMDVADFDRDGAVDVITGEHRGTKKVTIWKNSDRGSVWLEKVVAEGKESHLGTRVADLDGDGDLEIISIAWDNYPLLHLWRNDAARIVDIL